MLQHVLLVRYVLIEGRVQARVGVQARGAGAAGESRGQEPQLPVRVAVLHIDASQPRQILAATGQLLLLHRHLGCVGSLSTAAQQQREYQNCVDHCTAGGW